MPKDKELDVEFHSLIASIILAGMIAKTGPLEDDEELEAMEMCAVKMSANIFNKVTEKHKEN